MDNTQRPLVSVIIAVWNRKDELAACLDSLSGQTYPALETLVVDDGSTDGTQAMVLEKYPRVRTIGDPARLGHCFRRNQGLVESKGTYVLILDSDVEFFSPHTIEKMVQLFEADPTIGELGGEIAYFAGERDEAFGKGISPSGYPYRVGARRGAGAPVECAYLAGCNFMVRRDVAAKAGGFDPYYVFGLEDMDFGTVLRKMGYRNFVFFDCAVYHKASLRGRRDDEAVNYCKSRVRFLIKNRGVLRTVAQFLWDRGMLLIRRRANTNEEQHEKQTMMLKAYLMGLRRLGAIRRARGRNFLAEAEMTRFRNWSEAGERAAAP